MHCSNTRSSQKKTMVVDHRRLSMVMISLPDITSHLSVYIKEKTMRKKIQMLHQMVETSGAR